MYNRYNLLATMNGEGSACAGGRALHWLCGGSLPAVQYCFLGLKPKRNGNLDEDSWSCSPWRHTSNSKTSEQLQLLDGAAKNKSLTSDKEGNARELRAILSVY